MTTFRIKDYSNLNTNVIILFYFVLQGPQDCMYIMSMPRDSRKINWSKMNSHVCSQALGPVFLVYFVNAHGIKMLHHRRALDTKVRGRDNSRAWQTDGQIRLWDSWARAWPCFRLDRETGVSLPWEPCHSQTGWEGAGLGTESTKSAGWEKIMSQVGDGRGPVLSTKKDSDFELLNHLS